MDKHRLDPKGLIRESYRIEGITPGECRSIFLDWALSAQSDEDMSAQLTQLIAYYSAGQDDHPMTAVLKQGLDKADTPQRRGGWRKRRQ